MDKIDMIYDIVVRMEKKVDAHIHDKQAHVQPLTVKKAMIGITKFFAMTGAVLGCIVAIMRITGRM